ncbi:MAG: PadR family transcriptional regulator [bacterium]
MFKKLFSDFGINDGQLYPTLGRLERDGLVRKEVVQQEGTPNRHKYFITEEGVRQMVGWLESSEGEERSFRYDFVRKDAFFIRCNFIRHLDRDKAIGKVERQKGIVSDTIADFKGARDTMIKIGVDPLRVKILEYGIRNQEARLDWLEDFLEELKRYDEHKAGGACRYGKGQDENGARKTDFNEAGDGKDGRLNG